MSEAVLPPEPPRPDLEPVLKPASKPAPAPAAAPQKPPEEPARQQANGTNIDFTRLSKNLAVLIEQGGEVLSAILQPQTDHSPSSFSAIVVDAVQAFGRIAEYWLADPQRMLEARTALSENFLALWAQTLRRMSGETVQPVVPVAAGDRRFAAPQWHESPLFDFLRQAHAIATRWVEDLVARAETDPMTQIKAQFYLRQIASALSPANFLPTNPELLHETLASSGDNLIRGIANLTADIKAGNGALRIKQSDSSKFMLGVNMAATPGKVIIRNDLMELIQYTPTTETVFKRPLLIVPPWINKYYILDLNPEKSFVRYAVEQGHTVFLISWVNPDARHRDKDFEAYIDESIMTVLDVIAEVTGETQVNAIGYCVGGTLLAIALAYMARRNDNRIASATFFTTQTDFADAGDLRVFIDESQISALEKSMAEKGYLDGAKMANVFNMLRPNDLIWSFVVNNYIRGQSPTPFDLLTWNSDATRMTPACHSFYLRNCYLENKLSRGRLKIRGTPVYLWDIEIPVYSLATREDHIAPASSIFTGMKLFGGDVRFVVAGSGHIAGVINPPAKPKYQYWTGGTLS
ncbi:MAG: class I poly(R)-hydroxyalkanoic acid synthase, partial [Methylovirgula sp.]|nr:class I poly(R)-hydroxyalkanoic acid synthase [Methylovirgula sp.]